MYAMSFYYAFRIINGYTLCDILISEYGFIHRGLKAKRSYLLLYSIALILELISVHPCRYSIPSFGKSIDKRETSTTKTLKYRLSVTDCTETPLFASYWP